MSTIFSEHLEFDADKICQSFISCGKAFELGAIALLSNNKGLETEARNFTLQYSYFIFASIRTSNCVREFIMDCEDVQVLLGMMIDASPEDRKDFMEFKEELKKKILQYKKNAEEFKKKFEDIKESLSGDKKELERRNGDILQEIKKLDEELSSLGNNELGSITLLTKLLILTGFVVGALGLGAGVTSALALKTAGAIGGVGIATTSIGCDLMIREKNRQINQKNQKNQISEEKKQLEIFSGQIESIKEILDDIAEGMIRYSEFWNDVYSYINKIDQFYDTMEKNKRANKLHINLAIRKWRGVEDGFRRYLDAVCICLNPKVL